MRLTPLLFAVLLVCGPLSGQTPTLPSADSILTQDKTQAAAQHKNILLAFSASWCGPCHLFEAFLKDPRIKPILDKAFVESTLDVGESPTDTRHHDTPGAVDLRASLGGRDSFPYIAMLDPTGKPLANSLRPDKSGKANIGYPDLPVEIDWFMQMLAKSAPTLTPSETATIKLWLQAHSTSPVK